MVEVAVLVACDYETSSRTPTFWASTMCLKYLSNCFFRCICQVDTNLPSDIDVTAAIGHRSSACRKSRRLPSLDCSDNDQPATYHIPLRRGPLMIADSTHQEAHGGRERSQIRARKNQPSVSIWGKRRSVGKNPLMSAASASAFTGDEGQRFSRNSLKFLIIVSCNLLRLSTSRATHRSER